MIGGVRAPITNDNFLSEEEIMSRLDWVRPVTAAMRAASIPEAIVQRTMTYLLGELDRHLDGEPIKGDDDMTEEQTKRAAFLLNVRACLREELPGMADPKKWRDKDYWKKPTGMMIPGSSFGLSRRQDYSGELFNIGEVDRELLLTGIVCMLHEAENELRDLGIDISRTVKLRHDPIGWELLETARLFDRDGTPVQLAAEKES